MGDSPLTFVKKFYSVSLLIFSVVIVSALIVEEETNISSKVHPALAFVSMWLALLWLCMVEGGQASMVGLPPIDRTLYKESHPISWQICEYGHRGDNLDRYLMGRQFMVLALVFVINMSGAPIADADVLNLPTVLSNMFLKSGLAMILFTCMIGQLNTQVNASHCMLDFINTHFMTFTLYVAMGIEASGILHASYLIQMIVAKLAGKAIESKEPPRSGLANLLFWGRVVMSCCLLVLAFFVTLSALFDGKTTMWEGVPAGASVIFFFVLMAVVGNLEGMQIAFFGVAKMTEEERNCNRWARWCNELLFGNGGRGMPAFMIGRQLCVVSCFFIIARVTTVKLEDGEGNVLGVGDGAQKFFETGLLGAYITTIVASIAWQLVATAFPLAFLANPVSYVFLRIGLTLEATGLCEGAWVIAAIHKKFAGYKRDEVYVGTAEERAAMGHGDHVLHNEDVGHLGAKKLLDVDEFPMEPEDLSHDFSAKRAKILANLTSIRALMKDASSEGEANALSAALTQELAFLEKVNKEQEKHDKFRAEHIRAVSPFRAASPFQGASTTKQPKDIEDEEA